MPWYEILALSLAIWLVGSVLLALVLGGVFGAHQREDGAAQPSLRGGRSAITPSRPSPSRWPILYRRARNRRSGIDRRRNVAAVTIERRSRLDRRQTRLAV
jgi:hypothetical protein